MPLSSAFRNVNMRHVILAAAATGSLAAIYLIYRRRQSLQNSDFPIEIHAEHLDASKLKELGNGFFRKKEFGKAIEYYLDSLEKTKPDDIVLQAVLNSNLAAACAGLEDYDGAIDYANRSIAINPLYPKAYVRRAIAYEKRDMEFEFVTDIATSSILIGCNDSTRQQIDAAISKMSAQRTDELYGTRTTPNICLYTIQRFLIDLFPDDIFAENEIAELSEIDIFHEYLHALRLFKSGDVMTSLQICSALLQDVDMKELNDVQRKLVLLRSTCHFTFMDVQKTIEDTSILLALHDLDKKLNVAARLRICALYLHSMDLENCMIALNELRQVDPDRPHTAHFLGQVYMLMLNFAMARHCTKRAMNLDPTNVHYQTQMLLVRANEAKSAGNQTTLSDIVDEMRDICDKYPDKIELQVEYAQLLHDIQRLDEAEKIMDICISKADDSYLPHLLTQKAMQYISRHMYDNADALLDRAKSLDPYNETTYQISAMVSYRKEDLDKAIDAFRKAAEIGRGQQAIMMSVSMMITLEIQQIIMKRLNLSAKASSSFSTYLNSFDSI